MPTAVNRRATAGWYPDPHGPPHQLRWWDGNAWAADARAAEPRPPKRRRVIGWAALGAFALGVSGVVIAVQRGQDVCEVSATGIKFCENDPASREQVEQAQPAIKEQAGELQREAEQGATGETAPGTADFSGTWTSDDGFSYVIEQFGDQAVLTEFGLGGMATGFAAGPIDGSLYTFDFQAADGGFGTGSMELDGDTLTGSFDNAVTGISIPVVLHR